MCSGGQRCSCSVGEKLVEVHDRRSMSRVVCTLLPAIADGRIADVLALVDPHVVCMTATRPALTRYEGHAGDSLAGTA